MVFNYAILFQEEVDFIAACAEGKSWNSTTNLVAGANVEWFVKRCFVCTDKEKRIESIKERYAKSGGSPLDSTSLKSKRMSSCSSVMGATRGRPSRSKKPIFRKRKFPAPRRLRCPKSPSIANFSPLVAK